MNVSSSKGGVGRSALTPVLAIPPTPSETKKRAYAQNARSLGLCVIDAGHYGTEKSFAENMAEMLKERIRSGADIIISETDIDPFSKMYGI